MAISVSTGITKGRSNDVFGARRVTILRVTLDSVYAAGGEPFDPKQFGHQGDVNTVLLVPRISGSIAATTAFGRVFFYDYTAKTIRVAEDGATVSNQLDEVGAIDLSGTVLDVFVFSS
jgi:hypothetical protein